MFIEVDAAVITEEQMDEAELIGKKSFEDDEVIMIKRRVNPEHIMSYEQIGDDQNQSVLYMVDGNEMWCQNSPEQIDEMINNVRKNKLLMRTQ